MRKTGKVCASLMAAVLVLLFVSGPAAAEKDKKAVDQLIRKTGEEVLTVLRSKGLAKEAKKKKVLDIVESLLDFDLMAKLTLGRKHWPGLDKGKRKRFTALFKEQLQRSYFDKVDLFTDEVVEYAEPKRIQDRKYRMVTYIVSKGQRIELVYKLYPKGKGWKIYDLEIEGVSIVKSYGSQYGDFLESHSFDELLKKMREMNPGPELPTRKAETP